MTTSAARGRTVAMILLGLVALGSPQHYRDDIQSANEAARVHAAMALVDHGTLHLDAVWDVEYPEWRARGRVPNSDAAYRDGHYLLDKAPGITLLAVPVLAALRLAGLDPGYARLVWLLTLLLAALPSVLFLVLFRRWLLRSLGEPAATVAPALVLATPWLLFGAQLFGHAPAAALAGAGTWLALGPLAAGPAGGRPARDGLLGGLALGGAVLVEYPCALLAAGVAAALVLDRSRWPRIPWLLLGGLGPALGLLAWNTVCFGGPLSFSYAFKASAPMAAAHATGAYGIGWPRWEALLGLLLSARRGLLFLAPWLVAGLFGALWVLRDREIARAWRAALLVGTVGVPLALSGFPDWHGGQTLGPRYLVIALPAYGGGAALAVTGLARWRRGRPVLAALGGLVLSSLALGLAGHVGLPSVHAAVANPVHEVVLPVLFRGGPGPTVWDPLLHPPLGALLTVVAAAVLILLDARRSGILPAGRPRRLATILLVLAAALHLALGSLPRTEGPRAREIVDWQRRFAGAMQGQPGSSPEDLRRVPPGLD